MTEEIITIVTIVYVGAALVHAIGFNSLLLAPLYFFCGISIYVIVVYIQASVGNITSPSFSLTICAIFGFMLTIYINNKKHLILAMALSGGVIIVTVLIMRSFDLVKFHFDSINYLIIGSLLENGNVEYINGAAALNFSTIAALHAPANMGNDFYLRSLGPLSAISLLGMLFWLINSGLGHRLSRPVVLAFGMAGCILL